MNKCKQKNHFYPIIVSKAITWHLLCTRKMRINRHLESMWCISTIWGFIINNYCVCLFSIYHLVWVSAYRPLLPLHKTLQQLVPYTQHLCFAGIIVTPPPPPTPFSPVSMFAGIIVTTPPLSPQSPCVYYYIIAHWWFWTIKVNYHAEMPHNASGMMEDNTTGSLQACMHLLIFRHDWSWFKITCEALSFNLNLLDNIKTSFSFPPYRIYIMLHSPIAPQEPSHWEH